MKNLSSMTLLSAPPWFCGIGGGNSVRDVDVEPAVPAKLSSGRRLAAWVTARTAGASLWSRHIGWAIVWTLSLLLIACGGGDPADPGTAQATPTAASVVKDAVAAAPTGGPLPAVSAGGQHTVALKSDGTVWAWGANYYGQLGINSTISSAVPVQVPGLSGIVHVVAGHWHTVALKSDGTVWAWGYNADGELGNNTTTNSAVPVQVSGLNGVVSVAAGYLHSVALKSDGTIWAWGDNEFGELGNNGTQNSSVPVQSSALSDVVSVAAGVHYTAALKSDGTVWSWGHNIVGQLGNGTQVDSPVPVQAIGLTGVTRLSAGYHTVALKSDGTVWAFASAVPGAIASWLQVPGLAGVTDVDAGVHTVAVKNDGTAWAWGYNDDGQLGNNSTISSAVPVQVSGLTSVVSAAAGLFHTVALKSDGTVWTWGNNAYGGLGNNVLGHSSVPVQVVGPGGVGFLNLGARLPYVCGVLRSGLNTCDLQPGDILLLLQEDWTGFSSGTSLRLLAGTYWNHAAVYLGDGLMAHATGPQNDDNLELRTNSMTDLDVGWWNSTDLADWAVIRPIASGPVKAAAAAYARGKADQGDTSVDPSDTRLPVPYSDFPAALFRDKNLDDRFYCSQLPWKAYAVQGLDLETSSLELGIPSVIDAVYRDFVSPDDLYASVVTDLFGNRKAELVAQKVNSLGGALSRLVFRVFSPVHILLIDSVGRRTGFDPISGSVLNEIPGSTYTGPTSEPEAITFTGSRDDLKLIAWGTASGTYTLEMAVLGATTPRSDVVVRQTLPGQTDTFRALGTDTTIRLLAEGDIDGDGDVDQNDLRILLRDLNKQVGASLCGARCDISGDGQIDALDAHKLALLFTRR